MGCRCSSITPLRVGAAYYTADYKTVIQCLAVTTTEAEFISLPRCILSDFTDATPSFRLSVPDGVKFLKHSFVYNSHEDSFHDPYFLTRVAGLRCDVLCRDRQWRTGTIMRVESTRLVVRMVVFSSWTARCEVESRMLWSNQVHWCALRMFW